MKLLAQKYLLLLVGCFAISLGFAQTKKQAILIFVPKQANPRIIFGAERLQQTLKQNGYSVILTSKLYPSAVKRNIFIAEVGSYLANTVLINNVQLNKKESFKILSDTKSNISIVGADASGTLYGCLALISSIKALGKLPAKINVIDSPQMVIRGTCIGVQKSDYLPGRDVYEYPYTPQSFPWFYNKHLWIRYLDSLLENRMNALYLWNGHPFASLVKLKDYPYAVEVDSTTFAKNEAIYNFITKEADKRGIWVIQMFYNIIVSKPFANYHHIKTQDRNRPIIPLISDYTKKSIAAFVEKYPNVGLMVCLGEAMEGTGNDDIEWFTKTIIPGVKDGLKALGKTDELPIVLRAHDTDAPAVIKAAKGLYSNLYTEAKFNGEALTTYEPRGAWANLHRTLSRAGSVQIENVHILANLEPFRYGSADFIQKSVKAMHNIYEANGLHLYPQASYWDWPYTADNTSPRLLQIERDWIWYKLWSRYAWNSNRNRQDEVTYLSQLFAQKFGCKQQQGAYILEAYEQSGNIAPKLLRRFGITDGNRQTLTLGMLMTQLINPYRFGLFDLLYDCESPEGEKLIEYAAKEWKHEKHIGETPVQIIKEVQQEAEFAVSAINKAAPFVTKNKAEFLRLKNDMLCYKALAKHYAQKATAALAILRFKYSNNIVDLEKALPHLEQSVYHYKQLVTLTKNTYLYANSMQTKQRKIPIRGVDGTFKTWAEVLVPFEKELATFKYKIDSLKTDNKLAKATVLLKNASVKFTPNTVFYTIDSSAKAFTDTTLVLLDVAKELKGLRGIQLSFAKQKAEGTSLTFIATKPVKVLVGFFNEKSANYLKAPELETDASANNYGQSETKIANGVVVKGMPAVNIYSYTFAAGTNTLTLAKGACLIVGFIDDAQTLPIYDAGLNEKGNKKEIDWLFE
ncbi:MAG: hypothetical protein QM541_02205 [Flavobacterium sp.]|nr:hypothetical protein [Flavobacterium sp.]